MENDDALKLSGEIDGLWQELNVLRVVVAYLIARAAKGNDDPDGALRQIAEELNTIWDDRAEPESKRPTFEAARMAIDDLMAIARSGLDH
jgi:hypothetical protein